jgi:hypothetical protein
MKLPVIKMSRIGNRETCRCFQNLRRLSDNMQNLLESSSPQRTGPPSPILTLAMTSNISDRSWSKVWRVLQLSGMLDTPLEDDYNLNIGYPPVFIHCDYFMHKVAASKIWQYQVSLFKCPLLKFANWFLFFVAYFQNYLEVSLGPISRRRKRDRVIPILSVLPPPPSRNCTSAYLLHFNGPSTHHAVRNLWWRTLWKIDIEGNTGASLISWKGDWVSVGLCGELEPHNYC